MSFFFRQIKLNSPRDTAMNLVLLSGTCVCVVRLQRLFRPDEGQKNEEEMEVCESIEFVILILTFPRNHFSSHFLVL